MDPNSITLSEKDFSLLMDALDKFLVKDPASEFMMDKIMEHVAGNDGALKFKLKQDKIARDEKKKIEQTLLTDDVRVLQAKLILLKRELIAKANVHATDSILNYIK